MFYDSPEMFLSFLFFNPFHFNSKLLVFQLKELQTGKILLDVAMWSQATTTLECNGCFIITSIGFSHLQGRIR